MRFSRKKTPHRWNAELGSIQVNIQVGIQVNIQDYFFCVFIRYLCSRLVGLSGSVISTIPFSKAGYRYTRIKDWRLVRFIDCIISFTESVRFPIAATNFSRGGDKTSLLCGNSSKACLIASSMKVTNGAESFCAVDKLMAS